MTADESSNSIDLDALGIGDKARHARTATFAPNWKTVLIVDAAVGCVIVIVGVLAARWMPIVGWPIVAAGIIYILLVARRAPGVRSAVPDAC